MTDLTTAIDYIEAIPHDDEIALHTVNGRSIPAITSLRVAEIFGKRHDHVLRDIQKVLTQVPEIFIKSNFGVSEYPVRRGFGTEMVKAYLLSKDGFTLLTMSYTGEKAMQFKVAYINRFNAMEARLARGSCPDDPTALGLPDFRNPVEAAKAWARAIEEKEMAETQLEEARPKAEVYDKVVAPRHQTLNAFCRKLKGGNLNRVKRSLCRAHVLYPTIKGAYRVYAAYRDTHFMEKFSSDYGTVTIHVLPEGQKLLTRLYTEGRLEMKKAFAGAVCHA